MMTRRLLQRLERRLRHDVESTRLPGAQFEPAVERLPRVKTDLQVLLVQYDRQRYPRALERLVALLERLAPIDYSVLVLDNADPTSPPRALSSRLQHAGGDNSAWEFSAFDRGLGLLSDSESDARAYALVTDAFCVYGDEFLDLIRPAIVERVIESNLCIGWMDAWPEPATLFEKDDHQWVRTSFVFLPKAALWSLLPLTARLDPSELFSDSLDDPFHPRAPLSDNLKSYLLEWLIDRGGPKRLREGWHSRFVLTQETVPRFRAKVSAILREHLLSIRMREQKITAFDFRLFERLRQAGMGFDHLGPADHERLAWGNWRAELPAVDIPRIKMHVDRAQWSATVEHGEPVTIELVGWALSKAPPEIVELKIGSSETLFGQYGTRRDDVAAAFPAYGTANCGFSVSGVAERLQPGTHDVVLAFDGTPVSPPLGRITVIPKCEFAVRRALIPEVWPAGRAVPISIEGIFRGSFAAESAELLLDGVVMDVPVLVGSAVDLPHAMQNQAVAVNGSLSTDVRDRVQTLALRFSMERGATFVHEQRIRVVSHCEVASSISRVEVGPYDPETGLTRLIVDVDLYDIVDQDVLTLLRNGAEVYSTPLRRHFEGLREARCRVSIDRLVDAIPPGAAEFAIRVRRGGTHLSVWAGTMIVAYKRPELHVERMDVEPAARGAGLHHRIAVKGWVDNHFLVDCLIVEVDGSAAGVVGMHDFRPDVSKSLSSPLVSRQGFDTVIEVKDVSPGDHVVHVVATQRGAERARVSKRVTFDAAAASQFSIVSDDLERLARGQAVNLYGSVSIRGMIQTQSEDVAVTLLVNDRVVDEQRLPVPGYHAFSLRAVPDSSCHLSVRLVVSSRGRILYKTDAYGVHFRRLEISERPERVIGMVLSEFDLEAHILPRPDPKEILSRLVERPTDRVPEYLRMVESVGQRLEQNNGSSRSIALPDESRPSTPLSVLFVTWETPSRYHGGGVYLTNLLKGLSKRHEITLVHTYGLDEVGHVEALRPYVSEIISVPRTYRPAAYRGSAELPLDFYDGYVPELRRVIELELASKRYDLVDYEYSSLGPYVVPGPPSVLCVHELAFTAIQNTAFQTVRPAADAIDDIDRFLRALHYDTAVVPSLCRDLITLTEEDAESILRYCPTATVFSNPTGVDTEYFAKTERQPAEVPMFAYIGNFQHPPNLRAVEFFAREVMPALRKQYPDAVFSIVGSRMPAPIKDLDGKDGIRTLGFVDDLRTVFSTATAFVAPIHTGTGMRIKMLEAFASGCLVIGTELSVRGLPVVDGEHFYRATTAREFVNAASRCIVRRDEAARVAQRGKEMALSNFSWENTVERRDAIWQDVVHRARAAERSPAQMSARYVHPSS